MELSLKAVSAFMRTADTEDLLDRVTIYREGMEPAAVDLIEGELSRRGWPPERIAEHDSRRRDSVVFREDGTAYKCNFCDRPAVTRGFGWQRLWRRIPVFPRVFSRCERHGGGESS